MHQVKTIKCTHCAAPLELLGGGRVESITCSYCKSQLDLNDNYKVLTNFRNIKELHKLPFEIGMRGEVKGIAYTIIGRITYTGTMYESGEWTDFLLFSPLYGYAYLTYEEGHLIYSKRNRTFPNMKWSEIVEHASIEIESRVYEPFESYDARVTFVEGELTWIAKNNDKVSFIDLISPPFGISIERTKREIEYYNAEYLDSETIYEAFGAEKERKVESFHALQPFERPLLKALSYISFFSMFIIAILAFGINIDGSGKRVKTITATSKLLQSVDFAVDSGRYLVELELNADSAKELNNFNLQIHKKKHLIFSLTPTAAYTFDYEKGSVKKKLEKWSRSAKKIRVLLNLEKAEDYQLTVKPINQSLDATLYITINENYSKLNYFKWFFLLTVTLWLLYKFAEWRYKRRVEEERGI